MYQRVHRRVAVTKTTEKDYSAKGALGWWVGGKLKTVCFVKAHHPLYPPPKNSTFVKYVKSPNLFKISTSIVVNTGTFVTMNPQLLVSLERVRVSGLCALHQRKKIDTRKE